MSAVIPTPNLTVDLLQTGDRVRFLSEVDHKTIFEAEIAGMNSSGVCMSVNFTMVWMDVKKLQLVEGAWGRPISHLIGYDPYASEIISLRAVNSALQSEIKHLNTDLQRLQHEGKEIIARERERADQISLERDALAADLREVMV